MDKKNTKAILANIWRFDNTSVKIQSKGNAIYMLLTGVLFCSLEKKLIIHCKVNNHISYGHISLGYTRYTLVYPRATSQMSFRKQIQNIQRDNVHNSKILETTQISANRKRRKLQCNHKTLTALNELLYMQKSGCILETC